MKKIILLVVLVAGGVALSATVFAQTASQTGSLIPVLSLLLFGQEDNNGSGGSDVTGKLNDTGIIKDISGNLCNGTGDTDGVQDCSQGLDKYDGSQFGDGDANGDAGFSFTEINNGACVLDNVTGLVWEVKTASNASDKYKLETATSYAESFSGCGNTYSCRLPTVKELLSIVSYGALALPLIDTDYFPNTPQFAVYLSGTEVANGSSTSSGKVWGVNFFTGFTDPNISQSTSDYNVRAVCTAP
ncbi:Lcl C-terminal domain-containing protein [Candidatus Electrothrix sp.]|uniref:Lcl C-terminal domain-containing protein n=1 Tax=Candidatus Electrothrix sp. TaxID=2170559 RepID=UPI004057620A